jgi:hypothetical protein
MSPAKEPWHDCPGCPECGLPVVSPYAWAGRIANAARNHLWCTACGKDWIEPASETVEKAWLEHKATERSA